MIVTTVESSTRSPGAPAVQGVAGSHAVGEAVSGGEAAVAVEAPAGGDVGHGGAVAGVGGEQLAMGAVQTDRA
jgi:hypothetical protein